MPDTLDLNRGVLKRKIKSSGIVVCMYHDDPGVYLDLHGRRLPDKHAKQAGYDIDGLGKKRKRLEAVKRATEKVHADFQHEDANIVREVDGVGIEKFGEGRGAWFNVIDVSTGVRINGIPLKRAEAEKILDDITKPEATEPEDGDIQRSPDEGEPEGH